jgi:predicted RecB family nuclease
MLTLYGIFLSRLQGRMPDSGIIWHGQACQATKMRLPPDLRQAEQCLRDVQEMTQAVAPPPLILNQHCQVCEFRQRCYDQAVREDNLSLLRGMSEKEIKHHSRKGIFTITQLPAFSAKYPPAHARERARQSSPGAALRAGEGD